MIHTLHTKENLIYAYVVFYTKDQYGQFVDKGLYIHVEDMWIYDSCRGSKVIKELITYIDNHPETIHATHVYWRRSKYDRLSKSYPRSNFINREMIYGQ